MSPRPDPALEAARPWLVEPASLLAGPHQSRGTPPPSLTRHRSVLAPPDRADARGRTNDASGGRPTEAPPAGGRVVALPDAVEMARASILFI